MFAEKSHNYSLHELTTKKKPQLDSNTIIVNHSKIDPSPPMHPLYYYHLHNQEK